MPRHSVIYAVEQCTTGERRSGIATRDTLNRMPSIRRFFTCVGCAERELWYNRGIACRIVASRFGLAKERRSMILPFTLPTISPPQFDLTFFASAAGILLIDLVLSGDNALVIGATASRLPRSRPHARDCPWWRWRGVLPADPRQRRHERSCRSRCCARLAGSYSCSSRSVC